MGNPLRDRRKPLDLAASGQVIEFKEKVNNFERLAAAVRADLALLDPDTLPAGWRDAPVAGRLEFGFADAQNRLPAVEGHVKATYDAVCQRTLAPFRLSLDVPVRLVFGAEETGSTESSGYEYWELAEATITPLDVIDELLVMAMPLVAVQDDAADRGVPLDEVEESSEKIRPFAALKAQMDKEREN